MEKVVMATSDDDWLAVYSGGPYIEIRHRSYKGAVDVINVWDYVTDSATIPNEHDAVATRLAEWIRDYSEGYRKHVLPYNFR